MFFGGNEMARKIAFFNHKGGVSKTTSVFNVSWSLAEMGKRVLMVDTDPQCNLTGFVLGNDFEEYYKQNSSETIKNALSPAFESKPRMITATQCVKAKHENLFLLPGDITFSEYDVTLGLAQELSKSVPALHNVPGAINFLLEEQSSKLDIDYIIIDMSPSLSSVNQNLLMLSDAFIVPTAPDYFSLMAIKSLAITIPRWIVWKKQFLNLQKIQQPDYVYPSGIPSFLGFIVQKYRKLYGVPTSGFQNWIVKIENSINQELIPALEGNGAKCFHSEHAIASIPDFNTLMPKSQTYSKPVYALSDVEIALSGAALQQAKDNQRDFKTQFDRIANLIVTEYPR